MTRDRVVQALLDEVRSEVDVPDYVTDSLRERLSSVLARVEAPPPPPTAAGAAKEYTSRGFRIYGRIDEHDGGTVRVQESSLAAEGAHVWLFIDGRQCTEHLGKHHKPDPQLSVPQAKALIAALQTFVADAEGDELTEPAEAAADGGEVQP